MKFLDKKGLQILINKIQSIEGRLTALERFSDYCGNAEIEKLAEEIYMLPNLGVSKDIALKSLNELSQAWQQSSLNSQIVNQFIGADTTEKKVPLEISDGKYTIEDCTNKKQGQIMKDEVGRIYYKPENSETWYMIAN